MNWDQKTEFRKQNPGGQATIASAKPKLWPNKTQVAKQNQELDILIPRLLNSVFCFPARNARLLNS
jgi:hypothetical protein